MPVEFGTSVFVRKRGLQALRRVGEGALGAQRDMRSSAQPDGRDLIPESLMVYVADRLRVLGQPVRLRLVELLQAGECTPQALSDALGLSQQNVSKHLQVLYRVGMVKRRPEGANVFYALLDENIAAVLSLVVESAQAHLRGLAKSALADEVDTGHPSTGRDDATA